MNFKKKKSVKINNRNNNVADQQDGTIFQAQSPADLTNPKEYSQKVHAGFLEIKRKLLKIDSYRDYSEQTLERVLFWTGGQSFLTRRLFMLLAESKEIFNDQPENKQIDDLVQTKIISNWENNQLGLHLQTIKERLLNNRQCQTDQLLSSYQTILTEIVLEDQSPEQQELLNMGLVVRQQGRLIVANAIYQSVFSLSWVTKALNQQVASQSLLQSPKTILATSAVATNTSWFKFKNIFLLLTLIGLITILFNNISKRIEVKSAFQTGNQLLKQKSYAKAIIQYNQLLNINSNYYEAWTNRGYALAGLQKYEEMRESCSTATIIDPQAVYAWNCRGEALHNLQRYSEAIAAFDQAIALNQADPIFLINKSESLKALGKNDASITEIKQAIQVLEQIEASRGKEGIRGEFAIALTFLGNGYRQKKQYQNAIATYDRAIAYSANYFSAHIGKGMSLIQARRLQEAQEVFKGLLKNPQLTDIQQSQTWFHLGKALCNSKDYSSGIAAFERAIELKPDYKIAEVGKKMCS